ncbi:MAG: DUF2061 domain-containing protein [Candidatus Omnitrophica bacterium]|nr:DUF2061 domain-containing protein [Candidatus Omnitrophota bacterium]
MKEMRSRSIIKALSWRFFATSITILLVFIFTRRWVLSFEVGGLELITKLLFYYLHERTWGKIAWGLKEA